MSIVLELFRINSFKSFSHLQGMQNVPFLYWLEIHKSLSCLQFFLKHFQWGRSRCYTYSSDSSVQLHAHVFGSKQLCRQLAWEQSTWFTATNHIEGSFKCCPLRTLQVFSTIVRHQRKIEQSFVSSLVINVILRRRVAVQNPSTFNALLVFQSFLFRLFFTILLIVHESSWACSIIIV